MRVLTATLISVVGMLFGVAACVRSTVDGETANDDPFMTALCSIPPILDEAPLFEDRVVFSWLGGTGQPLSRLPVTVPNYRPGAGAQIEEMNVKERASLGTLANVALGRGRAWTAGNGTPVPRAPPELFSLPPGAEGSLYSFQLAPSGASESCGLQVWLEPLVADADGDAHRDADRHRAGLLIDVRRELEVDPDLASSQLGDTRRGGRCLQVRNAERRELPLRAFRVYETIRNGSNDYALSPHIIVSGDRVVYFSMGVVREAGRGGGEKVCCVAPNAIGGGCSRFGGPDPYSRLRNHRAVWSPRLPAAAGGGVDD